MPIITISRGCFSHGKEIAEKTANKLGYECVSREILLEASRFFNIPERTLLKSIHDAPTILDRVTHGKERYLSYIKAAILEHIKKDNVVYHGHAGHLLLHDFPHVLKVRVIAEMKDRVAFLKKQENMSESQAISYIKDDDSNRNRWTHYLYKKDVTDPQLYDIFIRIGELNIEDATEIICTASQSDSFKLDEESKKVLNDLAIVTHLEVVLQEICEAQVTSDNGMVHITARSQKIKKFGPISPNVAEHIGETMKGDLSRTISEIAHKVPGVKEVTCDIDPPSYS